LDSIIKTSFRISDNIPSDVGISLIPEEERKEKSIRDVYVTQTIHFERGSDELDMNEIYYVTFESKSELERFGSSQYYSEMSDSLFDENFKEINLSKGDFGSNIKSALFSKHGSGVDSLRIHEHISDSNPKIIFADKFSGMIAKNPILMMLYSEEETDVSIISRN
jgi:hypothetical protein